MPENNATEVVVPLIEVEEKVIDNAIRLKILKALSREGIFWFRRYQVAWSYEKKIKDSKTSFVIPVCKISDKKICIKYCTQLGYCLDRNSTDTIFAYLQAIENSWKYAKSIYACFRNLEETEERISQKIVELFARVWHR